MTHWHRVFGLAMSEQFAGTGWVVDVEYDVSRAKQILDVVVHRPDQMPAGVVEPVWPDGFGSPARYNLITFKGFGDTLGVEAIHELIGMGVGYAKSITPRGVRIRREDYRYFGVTMHYPAGLERETPLHPESPGAYDLVWGTIPVRIVVTSEMPEADRNTAWNLFALDPARVGSALQRWNTRLGHYSSIVEMLLRKSLTEPSNMPYTLEQFERELVDEFLRKVTPEQVLERFTPEQRLQGLPPEQRLQGMSDEEIEQFLQRRRAQRDG